MENLEKQISKKQNAILLREDFDAGPSNLDRIEPGLWLGECDMPCK